MFEVMLVDDEKSVRSTIKSKMNWEAAGFVIASEAGSGNEALKLLKRKPLPQVLISDMVMPQMDGIEFLRICREKYPQLRIVVLSGYSDFEYLRAAVRLGIKEYLLKPVARDELQELLARLAADLRSEQRGTRTPHLKWKPVARSQQLRLLQEEYLLQLVKDEWYSRAAIKERMGQLGLAAFAADDLRAQFVAVEMVIPAVWMTDRQERRNLLHQSFQILCRETAAKWKGICSFVDPGNPALTYFLITVKKETEGAHQAKPARFVQEVQGQIRSELKLDSSAGIGAEFKGLKALKNGFASMIGAMSCSRQGELVHKSELEQNCSLLPAFSSGMDRRLADAVERCDMKAFAQQLNTIFNGGSSDDNANANADAYGNVVASADANNGTLSCTVSVLALRIILMLGSVARKHASGGSSLQKYLWNSQWTLTTKLTRPDILERLEELTQHVMEEVKKTVTSSGGYLVEAIRKYAEENCGYELKITVLAEKYHLNEADLSRLFKQHVGVTLGEYVASQRAAKAEQLLQENELKLSDIAIAVGYVSPGNFNAAFKKYSGQSPKDYRDRYWKKRSEALGGR